MIKALRLKNSIAGKTIAALLVVILIPTVVISALYYFSASSIVKQNVRQTSVQMVEQAAGSLSNILNAGSDSSDLIFGDKSIQRLIVQENSPELSGQADAAYITNALNNIVFSNSFVKMVYVLREAQTSWGSGTFSQNKLNRYTLHNFSWIHEADAANGKLIWASLQYDLFSGAGENVDLIIPGVRVMKNFRTLQNIGYIMVNLDGKEALNILSRLKLGETGSFYVVNGQGTVMIHTDPTMVGTGVDGGLQSQLVDTGQSEFEYEANGVPYYGVKHPLSNGWILVGAVPVRELTGRLDALGSSIMKWSLGLFVLAIAIGLWSARRITSPIGLLTRQMKLVEEGNLQVRTTVESTDEIGLLSKQFNKMIFKVNELMHQVEDEQSKKRKAELRAVTHQINPHFMFNTLNTIRWLIKFGEQEKAYTGITNFNRLMEANMGKKGMMITLQEELDIIAHYLPILQLRYNLTFTLTTEIEAACLPFLIPRMILQPLVENAVFHGIVPAGRDGLIDIRAEQTADAVCITVRDNGIGIPPERLGLLAELQESGAFEQVGIGLKHIFECIELYFPPGSSCTFTSEPGQGATVALKLVKPAIQQPEGVKPHV